MFIPTIYEKKMGRVYEKWRFPFRHRATPSSHAWIFHVNHPARLGVPMGVPINGPFLGTGLSGSGPGKAFAFGMASGKRFQHSAMELIIVLSHHFSKSPWKSK